MGDLLTGKGVFCGGKPELPEGYPHIDEGRTCCFTGHRPEKMPSGERRRALCEMTADAAELLLHRGVDTFIIGMAPGFDLLAADVLLHSGRFGGIRLICAVPYKRQYEEARRAGEARLYREALAEAALIPWFFEQRNRECYRVRNQFMVNCSAYVIGYAADDDSLVRSGTGMTLRMAEKKGIHRIIIKEDMLG